MTVHPTGIQASEAAARGFSATLLSGLDDPFMASLATCAETTFHDPRFLATLERYLFQGGEKLLVVGASDERGIPVAAFFFAERRRFGIRYAEAVDFGLIDYFVPLSACGPLTAEECRVMWRAVVAALPPCQAVLFKKLPSILYGNPHLLSSADFVRPMGAYATTCILGPETEAGQVSLAREVRRKSKKLEKVGSLSFREVTDPQERLDYFDQMVAMRRARFAALGRYDALVDGRVVAFYRSLLGNSENKATARIFSLVAGERTVAIVMGFVFKETFTIIVPAIADDREIQVGSPGIVTLYKIQEWCRQKGFRVFDLSVGSLGYKARFDADAIELFEYGEARGPLGHILVMEAAARRFLRTRALRSPLAARFASMLEWLRFVKLRMSNRKTE